MMPFDSTTAAEAGRKGMSKRWEGDRSTTNRSEAVTFKATISEKAMIADKAAKAGMSRAEFLIRAAEHYNP